MNERAQTISFFLEGFPKDRPGFFLHGPVMGSRSPAEFRLERIVEIPDGDSCHTYLG
jgi:hypothetical protein